MQPDHLLIDALRIDHSCAQTKIIYGDSLSISIAAASVIAKVHRDAMMREMHLQFPLYGLASHKGYATPEHRAALRKHGPCDLPRRCGLRWRTKNACRKTRCVRRMHWTSCWTTRRERMSGAWKTDVRDCAPG